MIVNKFDIHPKEEFTDITDIIQDFISTYNNLITNELHQGMALIYSKHTTTCIGVIEPEKLLKIDMSSFLEHIAPSKGYYRHDDIINRDVPPDERRNGFSHLRAMLLNHSITVPVIDGKLDLGKWQRIFYIECDFVEPLRQDRTFNLCLI